MYLFNELVIDYTIEQLNAWKEGDKSLIPKWIEVPDEVYNQPNYHFGEYFVLRHFSAHGWRGFVNYAIGEWEPDNRKYLRGRKKIEEKIDPSKLSKIRRLRKDDTGGEPDVFLYKDANEILFLEVKKESDKISEEQLICLAQIKGILEADVGAVYLKEKNKAYKPKTYELNIDNYIGRVVESKT